MPGPWIFMCGVCLGTLITLTGIFVTLWRERLISKARIRNAYEKGVAQTSKKYEWMVDEIDDLWYVVEKLSETIGVSLETRYDGLYADGKLIKKENKNEL